MDKVEAHFESGLNGKYIAASAHFAFLFANLDFCCAESDLTFLHYCKVFIRVTVKVTVFYLTFFKCFAT